VKEELAKDMPATTNKDKTLNIVHLTAYNKNG
jgi:hypothetical protein